MEIKITYLQQIVNASPQNTHMDKYNKNSIHLSKTRYFQL